MDGSQRIALLPEIAEKFWQLDGLPRDAPWGVPVIDIERIKLMQDDVFESLCAELEGMRQRTTVRMMREMREQGLTPPKRSEG